MRIVCNLERPSELSWRARHGRKKKTFRLLVVGKFSFVFCILGSRSDWVLAFVLRLNFHMVAELAHLK